MFKFLTRKKTRGIRNTLKEFCIQKTFVAIIFSWFSLTQHALAQFVDDFSDGNFSTAPVWTGNTSEFVINATQQLQSNNIVAATSTLTTSFATTALGITEWKFYIKLTFAPSTTNFARVYLVSDQQNLTSPLNGYFLQFGEANATDAIELFRQTGSTITSICRGPSGSIANAFAARVKVTRDAAGTWVVATDYTGGTNFAQESSGTDNTITASSYFGLRCTYTLLNATKFFFDDFSLTMQAAPDLTSPTCNSVNVMSANSVQVLFSEALDNTSAQLVTNYNLGTNTNPTTATVLADQKTVELSFPTPFTNGVSQSLQIQNIKDLAQNVITPTTKTFLFFQPVGSVFRDVVINELFPDPTPVIGLPEAEFVELYNRSTNPFDLNGWTLTDGTTVGTLSSVILLPGEYLILSTASSSSLFQSFGKRMGLSAWPSLNNSGDLIKLKNPQGKTIDSVSYSITWYQSDEKKDGGYSLEMIDPENFCRTASNWKASESPAGGTPGQINSIFAIIPDVVGPQLTALLAKTASEIELDYDERLAKSAVTLNDFAITPPQPIQTAAFVDGEWNRIRLTFSPSLDSTSTYQIVSPNVHDCAGNLIQTAHSGLTFKLDQIKPTVDSIKLVNPGQILFTFSERLDKSSAETISHYHVSNYSGTVHAVLSSDQKRVLLTLTPPLKNGFEHTVTASGITDRAGNPSDLFSCVVLFFQKQVSAKGDIVLSEIMADPTPPVGLPEAEFIEIYNRSANPYNLKSWTLSDATSTVVLPDVILLPDSFLILTSTTKVSLFHALGKVAGISGFPSLNNTGEKLVLKDETHLLIDSISYSDSWYGSVEKKDGGYSLEVRDANDFCRGGGNWTASNDLSGGSPGKINSVTEIFTDTQPPRLLQVEGLTPSSIRVVLNEKLSTAVLKESNFQLTPFVSIDSVKFGNAELTSVKLALHQALDSITNYRLDVNAIFDCPGNAIDPDSSTIFFKMDMTPPTVMEAKAINPFEINVSFSEPVDSASATNSSNYGLGEGEVNIAALSGDNKSVRLHLTTSLTNGKYNSVRISGVTDRAKNVIDTTRLPLLYFVKTPTKRRDVIVSEIFSDPTPSVGLPEAEFIELYNRSEKAFNLKNWTLSDATSVSSLPDVFLLPGEYLILSSTTKAQLFEQFGKAIGVVSFPPLNNSGEQLKIRDEMNVTIDSLVFSDQWYGPGEKRDGGYSLERIDPEDQCRGAMNWLASSDVVGGTPGRKNSVFNILPDLIGPKLLNAAILDATHIVLNFNERLSSSSLAINDIDFTPATERDSIGFSGTEERSIIVRLSTPLDSTITYRIEANKVSDCPGNAIQPEFASADFRADTLGPSVKELLVVGPQELRLIFSESISNQFLNSNFVINGQTSPVSITLSSDRRQLLLRFENPFENGVKSYLKIRDVKDGADNVLKPSELSFTFFVSSPTMRKDVIITEIFADPTPSIGLPEYEFIEIFNRSKSPINLFNWKLSDAVSTTTLPEYILLPGHYLILCPTSRVSLFSSYGPLIGVASFPTLTNSGESLVLRNELHMTIDSVAYSLSYYHDDDKKDGGWSMELIDPENTCADEPNWAASEDENGGTPGRENSVHASKPDLTGPRLVSLFADSINRLVVQFNEKLERNLPDVSSIEIDPHVTIKQIAFYDQRLEALIVTTNRLVPRQLYSVKFKRIFDCAGNLISDDSDSGAFAVLEDADSLDVLINEVLFNPTPTGVDFVEVYNRSEKYINLKGWTIANKEQNILSSENLLLKPGEFKAFTKDPTVLKSEYVLSREENFTTTELPSLSDDEGTVLLISPKGKTIDHFEYSDSFHSAFIIDKEGVSLERISVDQPTNLPSNWKSASESAGFATPGYVNSNSFEHLSTANAISVNPEVFDPMQGQPSFAEISYSFAQGGFIANVNVIDNLGRAVKAIASNTLIGAEGFFRWDGDTDDGRRASIGAYMITFDVFDETGKAKNFRRRVVIAATP